MDALKIFKEIALGFPDTTEAPHFGKISFRLKKKIFATYDAKTKLACVKLSEEDQAVFAMRDKTLVYPVPSKWGKQGWTMMDIEKIEKELMIDALSAAYCAMAPNSKSVVF